MLTPTKRGIALVGVNTQCGHSVLKPTKMIYALVGVDTVCQHWVSTPTRRDTALEGVDTYQSNASFGRCQHLARQYLFW